jgi:hypothetical protein
MTRPPLPKKFGRRSSAPPPADTSVGSRTFGTSLAFVDNDFGQQLQCWSDSVTVPLYMWKELVMKASWRLSLMVATLACALTPLSAFAADIVGSYSCRGTNPDGSPYQGTVVIEENGAGYVLRWSIGDSLTYSGAGLLNDDLLSASWGSGVVVYRVQSDGKLVGKWLNASGGELGTETLTPR